MEVRNLDKLPLLVYTIVILVNLPIQYTENLPLSILKVKFFSSALHVVRERERDVYLSVIQCNVNLWRDETMISNVYS